MNTQKFKNAQNTLMRMEIGDNFNPMDPDYISGNISTSSGKRACGWTVDTGGETKYGISQKAWPKVNVKELNSILANQLYLTEYWNPSKADLLPDKLAICYYDAAVNMGLSRATKLLQRIVGAKTDGQIGPYTLDKINQTLKLKSDIELAKSYQNARIAYYHIIAQDNDNPLTIQNEDIHAQYERGWLNRINKLNKILGLG
jgi:lysozyme family protein